MDAKTLLKEFTTARWDEKPQMNDFVRRAIESQQFPLKKAFTLLMDNGVQADQGAFKKRIYCFELIANTVKDKAAAEHFLENIEKLPSALQATIVRVLKETNNPAWHPKALKLLYSKDLNIRKLGKDICSKIGGKTMFEVLSKAVRSRSLPSRTEAIETLANIAGHYSLAVLKDIYPSATKVERLNIINIVGNPQYMSRAKKEASNFLIECFEDKEITVGRSAIRALSRVGSREHVPLLVDMANRPDSPFLEDIIQATGQLAGEDDKEVVQLLSIVIRSRRPNIQLAAIDALYKIGNEDVLAPLSISLRDTNLQVRQRGADAFVKLANEGRVDVGRLLIFLLKERDSNVRRIAVEIIDSVSSKMPDIWKNLITCLTDTDWWVRERVTDVLVKIGGDKIIEHVLKLLSHAKEIVRRYAIEVLVRIGDPKTAPYLLEAALKDKDWWVRERAIEALGVIKDQNVVPHLLELLKDEELRWVTVKALGELKDKRSVPQLLPLLNQGEPEFRLDLLHALQEIGDRSMIDAVAELQYDVDRDVRQKAVDILKAYQVEVEGEKSYYKKAENLSMLDRLLLQTKKRGGTDLFLHSGAKPYIRYLADVIPVSEQVLSGEQVVNLIEAVLPEDKEKELQERGDTDFSYQIAGEKSRFRANIYKQRGGLSAVFRVINDKIKTIEELGFSKQVINLTRHHQGMILVTGPAGSGKTTTLMAMIDYINRTRNGHIITLEDPVEYIIPNQECLVNQREIGSSTESFATGLRAALREDPDIVLIGEMRDLETFSIAITAAETGHLVLGTLHTIGAAQTVDRLIDVFPHEKQQQIRSMISESLKGVITQQLVKKKDCDERMLVTEVMIMNDAISNMIRKGKTYQIATVLATGVDQGMHQMDMELRNLVEKDQVAFEEALLKAVNKKEFESYFKPEEEKEKEKSKGAAQQDNQNTTKGNT